MARFVAKGGLEFPRPGEPETSDDFAVEEQVWPGDRGERLTRIRQNHATYAAMVESVDSEVGRLLDSLDRLGVAEETIVVFTSDHGGLSTAEGHPTSNLPLRGGKGWLYEGGLRVPLLVRFPADLPAGVVSQRVTGNIDLVPTLYELAARRELDVEEASRFDGVSQAALWRAPLSGQAEGSRKLFWHYPHYSNQGGFPGGGVLDGSWKLLERYEDGRVHLFDLSVDAEERDDLAAARPEKVRQLRAELHTWYEEVEARFLEPLSDGSPEPWRPTAQSQ